tara:strand:+ start:388 stop:819 length:432 start_codon:yes stop_codon:yes gene_type:complete
MIRVLLFLLLAFFVQGCADYPNATGVGSSSSGNERLSKIFIQQSNSESIKLKYSSCLFCRDLPQTAMNVAEKHCSGFNKKARFDYQDQSEFWNYDSYFCVGEIKTESFEEKKNAATKQCLDIGFKEGTENFSNCILKLVAAGS